MICISVPERVVLMNKNGQCCPCRSKQILAVKYAAWVQSNCSHVPAASISQFIIFNAKT